MFPYFPAFIGIWVLKPCTRPHNGGEPRGIGKSVREGFLDDTDVVGIGCASPRCFFDVASHQVNVLLLNYGADSEEKLLADTSLFDVVVTDVKTSQWE